MNIGSQMSQGSLCISVTLITLKVIPTILNNNKPAKQQNIETKIINEQELTWYNYCKVACM